MRCRKFSGLLLYFLFYFVREEILCRERFFALAKLCYKLLYVIISLFALFVKFATHEVSVSLFPRAHLAYERPMTTFLRYQ